MIGRLTILAAAALLAGCDRKECHDSLKYVEFRGGEYSCDRGATLSIEKAEGNISLVRCTCEPPDASEFASVMAMKVSRSKVEKAIETIDRTITLIDETKAKVEELDRRLSSDGGAK